MVRSICLSLMLVLFAGLPVALAADATAEEAVHAASAQFYVALNAMINGDAGPLGAIWSHGDNVTTMHPIGGREIGWDQVGATWENVAKVSSDGAAELKDGWIRVLGDVAYEIGTEEGHFKLGGQDVTIHGRVTNIYALENGAWKVIHHHVDLTPGMVEALSQLPPAGQGE